MLLQILLVFVVGLDSLASPREPVSICLLVLGLMSIPLLFVLACAKGCYECLQCDPIIVNGKQQDRGYVSLHDYTVGKTFAIYTTILVEGVGLLVAGGLSTASLVATCAQTAYVIVEALYDLLSAAKLPLDLPLYIMPDDANYAMKLGLTNVTVVICNAANHSDFEILRYNLSLVPDGDVEVSWAEPIGLGRYSKACKCAVAVKLLREYGAVQDCRDGVIFETHGNTTYWDLYGERSQQSPSHPGEMALPWVH